VRTQIIAFDTAVVDLTESLQDPVELLFGVQLGGGTDINAALAYCQTRIEAPRDTVLVLVSDLFEGGNEEEMLQRARALKAEGVQFVCLLALNDEGAPAYDHDNAAALAAMGIPTFACTPDRFPHLMATAIQQQDITTWAATNDIPVAAPTQE
jgi:VWA domain-containing protein